MLSLLYLVVNIFALYNLYSCFAPLSLLWGEIFWCVRNKQHQFWVKENVEGLFSLFPPVFLDALQAEYTPFAIFFPFPFLSVQVKAFGTVNVMGPRRLLYEQALV